jgi:Rad52/22 family double-strand break repair protein
MSNRADINDPSSEPNVKGLTQALAAPFEPSEVKWKPQAVKGNRALAIAYIDARVIQDRLDEVLGVEGWQDEYQLLPDNSVMCKLRLKLGRRWITKMDVGSPSEQPDGGDRLKAAFSDALKRAAVKFGIGRYLYRLPQQWCDYDSSKRQFAQTPRLPCFAVPSKQAPERGKPKSKPEKGESGEPIKLADRAEERGPAPKTQPGLPADGGELQRRLREKDAELAGEGLCPLGALLAHVTQAGVKAGYGADITHWSGSAIELAAEETKKFKAKLPSKTTSKAVA